MKRHDHVGVEFNRPSDEGASAAFRRVGSQLGTDAGASGWYRLAWGVIGIVVLFSLAIVDVKYIGVLLLMVSRCPGRGCSPLQRLERDPLADRHRRRLRHRRSRDPGDPLLASEFTTFVVAGVLWGAGLARVAMARQSRGRPGWTWVMVAGLAALPLGIIILSEGPLYALFSVALFISLELLLQGTSCLVIAAAARR